MVRVGIVCKPDYEQDTTQQKACQDNGIIIIGIKKQMMKGAEYTRHHQCEAFSILVWGGTHISLTKKKLSTHIIEQ